MNDERFIKWENSVHSIIVKTQEKIQKTDDQDQKDKLQYYINGLYYAVILHRQAENEAEKNESKN